MCERAQIRVGACISRLRECVLASAHRRAGCRAQQRVRNPRLRIAVNMTRQRITLSVVRTVSRCGRVALLRSLFPTRLPLSLLSFFFSFSLFASHSFAAYACASGGINIAVGVKGEARQ